MIKNRNFHQTQLPGYAHRHDYMVDFNGIETFLFDSKYAPKSLVVGAPPQTPLEELDHHVLHTVGEDGVIDEFTSNLDFLATPLL